MHPFAEAHLNDAIALLRETLERAPTVALDRMTMARVFGSLVAIQQIAAMESDLDTAADTERPSHLRVVK